VIKSDQTVVADGIDPAGLMKVDDGEVDMDVLAVGDVELCDGDGDGELDGLVGGLGGGLGEVGPGFGVGWPAGGLVDFLAEGDGLGVLSSSLVSWVLDLAEGLGVVEGCGTVVGESRAVASLEALTTTAGRSCAAGVVPVGPVLATANAVPTPPAATSAVRPVSASTRRVPRLPTSVSTKSYRTDRRAPAASRRAACQKFTCFPSSADPWGGDGLMREYAGF
jgi:hypothetical protein